MNHDLSMASSCLQGTRLVRSAHDLYETAMEEAIERGAKW